MAEVGQTLAEFVSEKVGSWRFVIWQTIVIAFWVAWNRHSPWPFDPPPYLRLNLGLSLQAAYTGPVLLIAANYIAKLERDAAHKHAVETLKMAETLARLEKKVDQLLAR